MTPKTIAWMVVVVTFLIDSSTTTTHAIDASPHPYFLEQPNGDQILVVDHGDEEHFWTTDINDYLIVQNTKTGEYVYCFEHPNGDIIPIMDAVVGATFPWGDQVTKKIPKQNPSDCFKRICGGIPEPKTSSRPPPPPPPPNKLKDSKGHNQEQGDGWENEKGSLRNLVVLQSPMDDDDNVPVLVSQRQRHRRTVATTGTVKNLVVLLYFKDHWKSKRKVPSIADIDMLMNAETPHPHLCPTGSLKGAYREMSHGQLTIESTVTPWFVTSQTESYYADKQSGTTNLHEALREALTYLDRNNIVNFGDFDQDRNGRIDSVTFLHSGYGAEWGSKDCYKRDKKDRIWSHKWTIWSDSSGRYIGPWVSKTGVIVSEYHISPALWGTCGSDIGRIGVIAHETGHFLGLPDLYDRNGGGRGLGGYCLMASSWGFDGQQYYPGQMSAWSKLQLGWLQAHTPAYGKNLVANAEEPSAVNQLYIIESGFAQGSYLLIENRQKKGLDSLLPSEGLAIYHIDNKAGFDDEGHPGQVNWPRNGLHYRIALLQADGFYDLERGDNKGGRRDFFHAGDVDQLLPSSHEPENGPFPNTDSYQGGNLLKTGVEFTNIGASGEIMWFVYTDPDDPANKPDLTPSAKPSLAPSMPPSQEPSTAEPSVLPSVRPSYFPTTTEPSPKPSISPTISSEPSAGPPVKQPSDFPSSLPTNGPSPQPSPAPSFTPSSEPSPGPPVRQPSAFPSPMPTIEPSLRPSLAPSLEPSATESAFPSSVPSSTPSLVPSPSPSEMPTLGAVVENPIWVVEFEERFDKGFGTFQTKGGGGNNANAKVNKKRGYDDNTSLELRDATVTSMAETKDDYDVSLYTKFKVSLYFFVSKVDASGHFYLEYSTDGGVSWHVIKTFQKGADWTVEKVWTEAIVEWEDSTSSKFLRLRLRTEIGAKHTVNFDNVRFFAK